MILVMAGPDKANFDILRVSTGGEEELTIIERRNLFFTKVLGGIHFDILPIAENPFITVEGMSLGHEEANDFRPSDDTLHKLIVFNELVALVIDRRDDFNYHEVTFWQREPSDACMHLVNAAIKAREG